MIFNIVLLGIILVQSLLIWYLITVIDKNEEEHQKYFNELRRDYDIRIENMRLDYETENEINQAIDYMRRVG